MAEGNAHFILLAFSRGDPTVNATEATGTVIHTVKALGPCHSCFQKLIGFLPASPTTATNNGVLGGISLTNLSSI